MAYLLISLLSIAELLSHLSTGIAEYAYANIALNIMGFALAPAVPIFLVYAINRDFSSKIPILCEVLFTIFVIISVPFKWIFEITQENDYSRGELFFVYIVVYIASIVYLVVHTWQMAMKHQRRNFFLCVLLFSTLVVGTTVQVISPQIHITWLCVTATAVLYYIYCNEIWSQTDALTGLLNQRNYLNKTAENYGRDKMLIVFDIDNFKLVNDTRGHLEGDRYLKIIGDSIMLSFAQHGYCYRIGGDEFCVLLRKEEDAGPCIDLFTRVLEEYRESDPHVPHVSYGSTIIMKTENISTAKERADRNMYYNKNRGKL